MTLNPLTLPPAAPSRSDPPAIFITRADAFINWWSGTFAPEFNALLPEIVLAGSANNYGATSTTSLAIGTGSKSLTVQADKAFQVGQFVQIANTATPANYMFGQVTAYNASTGALTVLVSAVGGSGTFAAWTIGLAATGGAYAQLAGANFTGTVAAPTFSLDAGGYLGLPGGNFVLQADNLDFFYYHRVSNFWRFLIGNVTRLDVTATGGKLYGDWTHEGATYFSNDTAFSAEISAGNPSITVDASDYIQYNRASNVFQFRIASVIRFQITDTQALVGSDPVVTRTSTDTLTNKTLTAPTINSAALNPSGAAPLYPARARVSFDSLSTIAITDSGNVSSITDNGLGDYTVNFTTAMPNANYQWHGAALAASGGYVYSMYRPVGGAKSTTGIQLALGATNASSTTAGDSGEVCVVIFA